LRQSAYLISRPLRCKPNSLDASLNQALKGKSPLMMQKSLRGFLFLGLLLASLFLSNCAQTTTSQPAASPQTANPAPPPPPPEAVQPPSMPSAAGGQFEQPPVVSISELLPANLQSGPGFQVGQQVATNGAMGEYTITASDTVFHEDAGTYQIESLDLLKIRLAEVPAIAQLDNMSSSAVFAKEFAVSAARPVAAAGQMVVHPIDTITGLPSGVGEFFGRVDLGAKTIYKTASNASESGEQRASETAQETGNITLTALGYDQVRRDLARKLHVDPYSSDPVLTKRLNHVAWVMFSARITVDAAMMAVPASMIITGTEFTDDLVYQTPKGDLILFVEKKLTSFGLSKEEIATFTHNTAIPLSLQVAAVRHLDGLGHIPGRRSAAVALGSVMTEYQARFLVTSLSMLDQWSTQKSPIRKIQVTGVLVGYDQNGTTIIPAPIDYLSWTPRIAGFATNPQLLAKQNRVLWITGKISPLAQRQVTANGWTLQQGPQL
jgi:hypothetical protein